MLATAKLRKHRTSTVFIVRLTKDEAITFGHCIGSEDDRWLRAIAKLLADRGGFAIGQLRDQPRRAGLAANATLDVFRRRNDRKVVAGFLQQFAPPRGTAGENEVKGAGGWRL